MRLFTILLFTISSISLTSQGFDKSFEDGLMAEFAAIYDIQDDEAKITKADEFVNHFKQSLYKSGAYDYDFAQLKMAKLNSPDDKFKLFNWNVNLSHGKEKYYALIMIRKKDRVEIIELHDHEESIKNIEQTVLTDKKWMGALYYDIIPFKKKGRTQYVLLGWDGYSNTTNKKVIDVLTFNGKGVRFGAPIFVDGKTVKKRVVFEYAEDAVMSIKYEAKDKRLVFDHIAPIGNQIEGEKEFYGPDLTFDAYQLKKGKWLFIDNLEYLRPGSKKDKDFRDPREKK